MGFFENARGVRISGGSFAEHHETYFEHNDYSQHNDYGQTRVGTINNNGRGVGLAKAVNNNYFSGLTSASGY
jgi:hypothetical protein